MIHFRKTGFAIALIAGLVFTSNSFAQDSTSSDGSLPATTAPAEETVEVVVQAPAAKTKVSRKGKMNAGGGAIGFYEYSTTESLYVDFSTDEVNAAGAGFKGFFEYGLNDRLAIGGSLTYSYVLYVKEFDLSVVTQSFWSFDFMGAYYFTDDYSKKFQPYAAFGAGAHFSGNGVTPLLDLGVGMHYRFNDYVSLKTEILGKTAIVHNRGEAFLGIAFHF